MFSKKNNTIENASTDNVNIVNNAENDTKLEIKKDKSLESKKDNVLGLKNTLNLVYDIIEKLSNKQILTSNELKLILEKKPDGFFYKHLIDLMNDVHSVFGKEKEEMILESFFNIELGYKVDLSPTLLTPSTAILDLFNSQGLGSFTQEIIDNIFATNILPVQIISENKLNTLVIISRSIEIPDNLLSVYKELIEKKKITDMKFILVNKYTYDDIHGQLDNNEYSHSI